MDEKAAALADALARLLGGEIAGLHRLTGGASRATWSGTASTAQGPRRFVLQRREAASGLDGQAADMAGEANLIRAAHRAGVPTAEVLAACGDPDLPGGLDALGQAWVVMDYVDGETIARRLLRDDEWAAARQTLVAQTGAALAAVHRIPISDAPHLQAVDPIERFRAALDLLAEPHPALELGLRWLDQHRPPAGEPAVVHGDFRLGNWIVGPDGLRAVVDWELAHVGDPGEDLGWMCVRAWRFGGTEPAAGLGTHAELLDAYHAAGGRPTTLDTLRWWEVFGTLAWGVMCIAQASRHRSGATRSVELAAIGRRTCENEHDLLQLLPGPDRPPLPDLAAAAGHPDTPHDPPGAADLLDAVAAFLREDVMAATEGRVQFHSRVAANVVDQVKRQFEQGGSQARDHAERLRALGFDGDAGLAAAIRAGEVDDRFDDVKTTIWQSVLDKVSVAHPGYADGDDQS